MNTLWIETYRPKTYTELVGQQAAAEQLHACAVEQNLPHLMVIGKTGTGKSSALEIFTRECYGDTAEENTTELPVSVMFTQGHAYLETCTKFAHLYDKSKSVLANFKYIVKWHASLKPLSAPFRLIIFDGAENLPRDAQSALRRIMERYSATCRFIFVTSSASRLIDPIRSRCVPLYFLPIDSMQIRTHLDMILKTENKTADSDLLDMITISAHGDLRRAVMYLELAACYGVTDPAEFGRTETGMLAESARDAAKSGDETTLRTILENLQISYGMTAGDVIRLLHKTFGTMLTPEEATVFANADIAVREGGNEYLQMNVFAAELIRAQENQIT